MSALAREAGYRLFALTIDYRQRHAVELDAARRIAARLGAERHVFLPVDLGAFGGSALTADVAVPKGGVGPDIPVTYVPARNTVFLSLALAWAEAVGARDLWIGVNALDYSGYPDCRPEFIAAFERLANLATKAGVDEGGLRVHAPLIAMSKADIVVEGLRLGVDFAPGSGSPRSLGRVPGYSFSNSVSTSAATTLMLLPPLTTSTSSPFFMSMVVGYEAIWYWVHRSP